MIRGFRSSPFVLALAALVVLAAPALAIETESPPDLVVVERPGLIPEGIEWDALGERFLLSSLADGTVYAVTDDGEYMPLVEDDALSSSVGIEVDASRNRLLVANSDSSVFSSPDAGGQISLGIYDLETGERLHMVDLQPARSEASRHFANDVAVDEDGNAYVTDSFSPVIYRVDPDGQAVTFAQDDRFGSDVFGLNGIVYHPDGFLLAAVTGDGALYRIPLDDPEAVTQVELDQPVYIDGMVLDPDGDLVAVDGRMSAVVALRSEDGWSSAVSIGEVEVDSGTTTVAVRGHDLYALYAHLADNPPSDVYEIVRIDFRGALPDLPAPSAADDPAQTESRNVAPVKGAFAPGFEAFDIDGNTYSLKDYQGQPVLLNFWATWCPYCRAERSALQALFEEYGDRKLAVLSVDIGESANVVRPVVEEEGLTFPVLLDEMRQIAQIYRVSGIPSSFLIDGDGMIVDQLIGPVSEDRLGSIITSLLD